VVCDRNVMRVALGGAAVGMAVDSSSGYWVLFTLGTVSCGVLYEDGAGGVSA